MQCYEADGLKHILVTTMVPGKGFAAGTSNYRSVADTGQQPDMRQRACRRHGSASWHEA
jgi:hypothetical protein